jgi:DNA-binding protein YbaB
MALRGYSTLVGLAPAQDELKQMQTNTVELEIGSEEFRYWSRQARGAASVMVRGERNLHEIETAERQFNSLP